MRRISDPDFVYRPWSEERRQAAIKAAETRIFGSPAAARKIRLKKLHQMIVRRDKLTKELGVIRAHINNLRKHLS